MKQKTEKRETGDLGEQMVCDFLRKQGYVIRETNFLRKCGEIDIIAERDGVIHFVEVKTVTRRGDWSGPTGDNYEPEDNIHPWKLKRIYRTLQVYLMSIVGEDEEEPDWQIDIAAVYLDENKKLKKIEYLEDPF